MRRLILGLLLSLVSFAAHAACPGNPPTCGNPMMSETSGSVMYATAYGVKADGVTPDDVALKAAVDACAVKQTELRLPPGQILLSGSTSIVLTNCHLVGVGVPGGNAPAPQGQGTMILLTGTSPVSPFVIKNNWAISGVNFYWPNQTSGTQVYPALFTDDGSGMSNTWSLDHVNIINAYIGFKQTNGGGGWAGWFISDSWLYAVREMFNINRVSDSVQLSNVHFTPGPWLNTCAFSLPCKQAVDAGAAVNMIFHFTAGAGVNVTVTNAIVFDWRFGIYVDAGATVAISPMEFNFDGTGTMLHVETGGLWAGNALLRGSSTECATYSYATDTRSGNPTCINLAGPESTLVLDGFVAGGSRGNFVRTNGSNVYLTNVKSGGVGGANDGADYFALDVVGSSGGTNIVVKNSSFAGRNGSAKAHGIVSGPTVSRIVVENNDFSYFNEAVAVPVAPTTIITGNWSINTLGSQSMIISGSNQVVYRDNQWDKPPIATVTGCGGSGAVVVGGAFAGFVTVGSTNPTTACTLVQPFALYGVAGGLCNFWGPAVVNSAGPVSATAWQVVFASTVHGQNVFFNCVGQN